MAARPTGQQLPLPLRQLASRHGIEAPVLGSVYGTRRAGRDQPWDAGHVPFARFPYGDPVCPVEDPGLLERGRLFCPRLTPIAAQSRGLAGVDGGGGLVGKSALPTAVVDFPGFSAYELGDFVGAVSVDREAVSLLQRLYESPPRCTAPRSKGRYSRPPLGSGATGGLGEEEVAGC